MTCIAPRKNHVTSRGVKGRMREILYKEKEMEEKIVKVPSYIIHPNLHIDRPSD